MSLSSVDIRSSLKFKVKKLACLHPVFGMAAVKHREAGLVE